MSIHVIGIIGLVVVFVVVTTRSVNLGAVALVMTFVVGSIFESESVDDMYAGFPADLFVLLVGVTYLFGIAVTRELPVSAVVVALAVSATVVDCTPFSTVGALVLANSDEGDRPRVYRTMIGWGALMVVTAPIVTFLVFILPFS